MLQRLIQRLTQWLTAKRWRIILTGVLVSVLPIVILATFVISEIYHHFTERVMADSLLAARVFADRITDRLDGDIAYGKAYAARPYLLEGLQRGDKKELDRHLRNLIENSLTMERVFLTSPAGIQLAAYPEDPATLGKDFSHRDWYQGVSKGWQPYISEFYLRAARPQRQLFAIALPLRASDQSVVGILVMQPKAEYIQALLAHGPDDGPGIEGHAYVVDNRGRVIYHPDLKNVEDLADFSARPGVQRLLQGEAGAKTVGCSIHMEREIIAYVPVRKTGWGVVIYNSQRVLFAPLRHLLYGILGFAVVMLTLGGFVAYRGADIFACTARLNRELAQANEEYLVMNEELKAQQQELTLLNQRLEKATRAKSDFLANMSHELRTPMNSILGFSEVLREQMAGELNEKQHEYVNYIHGSGKHLLSLINDILDLAKVEAGKMTLEANSFALQALLVSSMTMFKEKAIKHGIAMELDLDPALTDELIEADERKLKQILFNLLSNAVKFTPPGKAVRVSLRREPDNVVLAVEDEGIGIHPDELGKVFEKFFQGRNAIDRSARGTGLGLTLVKHIVEAHGGSVRVESRLGHGSTFSLVFPIES